MRITNKIMQNNSVTNINNVKNLEDKLNTQLVTGKVITRPSDDPVVAIRALRLRNNVTETSQYLKKNVPDASSWMKVTQSAIDNVTSLIEDMYEQSQKGINTWSTAADLSVIVKQLRQYSDEVFQNGDSDYAGRTVFTGYRTGSSLTFKEDTSQTYQITEDVYGDSCFDKVTYVDYTKVDGITVGQGKTEQDVASYEVNRIRLAYKDCDLMDANNTTITPKIQYYDANGNLTEYTNIKTISLYDTANNPYEYIHDDAHKEEAVYVPETGEILLGQEAYERLQKNTEIDNETTKDIDERKILITYEKTKWASGETRPEHYFKCSSEGIAYNAEKDASEQYMEYDVGLNQIIRINTTAPEIFSQGIAREVDELESYLTDFTKLESYKSELEEKVEADPDNEELKDQYDAVNKAYELMKDTVSKRFSSAMTAYQGYMDKANLAQTDAGARGARLDLIEERLSTQKENFDDLKSQNEDIDETEVAIDLTSAKMTYEAALMATSKIISTTLLNYI